MIKNHIAIQLPVAIVLGLIAILSISLVWGLHAQYSPFLTWMIDGLLIPGHKATFYAVIYAHEVLVNIALAYPFALLFSYFFERNTCWRFISVAMLTMFVSMYWSVIFSGEAIRFFTSYGPQSLVGAVSVVGALPIAYLLVRRRSPSHAAA